MSESIQPFHLAFTVSNLEETHTFYTQILGYSTGRSSDQWIDFNMWGHQVVAHLSPEEAGESAKNAVDEKAVPVPVRHFGVILEMDEWKDLAKKVKAAGIEFIIEPYVRFKGEQATMFFSRSIRKCLRIQSLWR